MTGHDCLYKQWLGVESPNPSFYDLLEIGFDEPDLQVIKEAADRALSKVRSFKPGAQAKQWAMLLDELTFALKTLTDSELRSAYDQQLERGELVASLRVETTTSTEEDLFDDNLLSLRGLCNNFNFFPICIIFELSVER